MTIKQAKKHPAYAKARSCAFSQGFRGGMEEPEFGCIVMAYLAGYNAKDKTLKLKKT